MLLVLAAAVAFTAHASPAAEPPPRDPFASLLDMEVDTTKKPPLERARLEDMRLEGVVAATAAPRALIALPDGTSHVIHVGTPLGPALGRVIAIRPGIVIVREEYRNAIGALFKRDVELTTRR